jgi:hypothetical protein
MEMTQGMSGAAPRTSSASGMPGAESAPGPGSTAGVPSTPSSDASAPGTPGAATFPVAPLAVARMEEEIARLTRQGYVIVSRSETSAQLRRRKHFSILWAFFWFLVGGIGLPLYIAWYLLVKRDRVAFVRITPEGRVLCTEG